ncbi:MAG TPA: PPC domain-containing protein [Gemmatimonadales bacterium]|nr:PPC domain-containing protein [Gemmatimonadales bacterium]
MGGSARGGRPRRVAAGWALVVLGCAAAAAPLPAQQADPGRPLGAGREPAPAASAVPGPGEIGRIRVGQTMRGVLEPGDQLMADSTFADVWELDGAAGEKLTIDVRSDEFDTFLQLLDPSGTKIGEDDDSGGDLNSRLTIVLPAAGRYRIVVNSAGHERRAGRYTLTVR